MGTWWAMARDSAQSAEDLWPTHQRSAFSRLYYAAYARVAGWLETHGARQDALPTGDQWYSHRLLVERILEVVADWKGFYGTSPVEPLTVTEVGNALSRLFRLRVDADYRPDADVEQEDFEDARRDMLLIFEALPSRHGETDG